jgi:putative CocE/NonD family hydrolase
MRFVRVIRLLLALTCALTVLHRLPAADAQSAPAPFDFKASYTKSEFYIPMRDGVRLFTSVYAPRDTSHKVPFLMTRTPYSCAPYGPDGYPALSGILQAMAVEGYIFVQQDVRGRFMSEGTFVEVRPEEAARQGGKAVDESTDAYDTIDWLVKCIPNNNGRVGIWGISYPGFYAGAAGIHSHPALKAISPQAPVSDWFIGDDDHHNGALFLLDYVGFYNFFGTERPDNLPTVRYPRAYPSRITDAYQYYLDLGPLKNIDAQHWHGKVTHWNEVTAHPNYDAFWKARALPAHLKGVHCAVLTVGGWYDAEDRYGPFADFQAINTFNPTTPNSLVIGPWTHGGWAYGDFNRFGDEDFGQKTGVWYRDHLFKPFFDHYLKDQGDWKQAKVTVFATGLNQWWQFAEWPPRAAKPVTFTLGPNHTLTPIPANGPEKTSDGSGYDEYVSDPANPVPYIAKTQAGRRNEYLNDDQRFAAVRPDVVTWQSEPLAADLTAVGSIQVDLQASTTGTDSDFVVKVIDVLPDDTPDPDPNPRGVKMAGYQRLVRGDVMRARYRDSYSDPKAMSPGKITRVSFPLRDVCHTFLKGHRIMVQVQSSWFPLVDRNPQSFVDIYHADATDFKKATQRIYHTSRIILQQLPQPPPALPAE